MPKYIPEKRYREIRKSVPIVCIDAVIKTPKGVLLGLRNNPPVRGKLWFVGGRVYFWERIEDAVVRKVREETGLRVKIVGFVGPYATRFQENEDRHTVNLTYLVAQTGGRLIGEGQHAGFVYVNSPYDKRLDPYVRGILVKSGVFSKSRKLAARPLKVDFLIKG